MRKLNENYVYSLEELTNDELQEVLTWLIRNDEDWRDCDLEEMLSNFKTSTLRYDGSNYVWSNREATHNAKELFYTLKDIQVDCSDFTGQLPDAGEKVSEANLNLQQKPINPYLFSGWYKSKDYGKWLMYFDFKNKKCFGFSSEGKWYSQPMLGGLNYNSFRAKTAEVKKRLVEHAIKKGYNKGTFEFKDNILYFENNKIMKDGFWLPILEKETDNIIKYQQVKGRGKNPLELKLIALEFEKEKVEEAIKEVKKEISDTKKVLMFMNKKGVPTFAFHNRSQLVNLLNNGWKTVSKEDLINEMEKYD